MSYNMSTGLWGRADEDIRFPSAVQTSLQITAKEYIADISSDTKLQETSVEGFADDLKISFNGPLCHEAFLVSSEVLSGDEVLNQNIPRSSAARNVFSGHRDIVLQ